MDISDILARPHRMNVGRETPFVEGFATELASVGHSALTINGYEDVPRIVESRARRLG